MKRLKHYIIAGSVLTAGFTAKAQVIATPGISSKTTFAIVADKKTYDKVTTAIKAYKTAIEKDGLGTYILAKDWTNPEEIRNELQKLYKKTPRLEGAVFVGDVPVPMVRDAQYLTSAFKMDQRHKWTASSVPSDRYYDDFGLKFSFIKRDSANPLFYYYSLLPESRQYISMNIYSGRIKPAKKEGQDWYKAIEAYLQKVVADKADKNNKLDNAFVYTGHGYNSESLNSWAGEQIALREQIPGLFKPGGYIKFMNFRMNTHMKFNLLSEVQREDLDLAIFHEHGSDDAQLINGYPYVSNPQPSIENIRRYLRSKLASAKRKKQDVESVKQGFVTSLGVPAAWMDDTFNDDVVLADSTFDANTDISITDVENIKPNARFVMMDACLNGTFQLDDYIAAHYPFGKGKTILAIANSVGVLQDLWPDEMLGLLQFGTRTGNWFKHIANLETHIIGDPTFHFKKEGNVDVDNLIVNEVNNVEFWKKMLNNPSPDIQCLALVHIFENQKAKSSSLLKEYYYKGESGVVRLEAFKLLEKLNNNDFIEVLKAGIKDPYEMVRRQAAYAIGDIGSDNLVKPMVELMVTDRHSRRVSSRVWDASAFMNHDAVISHAKVLISKYDYLTNQSEFIEKLITSQKATKAKVERDLKTIMNKSGVEKERLSEISHLRNYNYHTIVPQVVSLAYDKNESNAIRIAVVEAMGWFTHSYQAPVILKMCNDIIGDKTNDAALIAQATKTKNILMTYN